MSDKELLYLLRGENRKVILLHHNADIDCVSSAISLLFTFPGFHLYAPKGISSIGRKILGYFGAKVLEKADLSDYNWIFLLDANSLEQFGEIPWEEIKEKTVVIDHHDYNPKYEEAAIYLWAPHTSCSEVILEFFEKNSIEYSEKVAEALIMGIIGDTSRFKFAKTSTMQNVCKLLSKIEKDLFEVIRFLESSQANNLDRSRRIAILKGMGRSAYLDYKGVLIAKSYVSSFEGDVASVLVSIAADISVVGAQRKEEVRISVRARPWLVAKGLNLAEICRKVGEEFSGGGGGHPAAAGINAIGDAEAIVNAVVEEIVQRLKAIL